MSGREKQRNHSPANKIDSRRAMDKIVEKRLKNAFNKIDL